MPPLTDVSARSIEMPTVPLAPPVHPSPPLTPLRLEALTVRERNYYLNRWGTDARPIVMFPLGWGEWDAYSAVGG